MKRCSVVFVLALWLRFISSVFAADRPNIVLIMVDNMGDSDIGCYSGEIETPSIDALAEGGIRYTQFCNTGRCCPTRASLTTNG